METVAERFLRYVAFDTQSDELSETCPSTEKQKVLGQQLVADMKAMGIADARMDENGYVYGTVPGDPSLPTIGLIAHMDTAPDAPGANIRAKIVPYDGEDVLLNEEKQIYLREDDYPILKNSRGKHLIVTDGTTLLGADDKAGVAEILTAIERLQAEHLPHGPLCVAFTPDEEIGEGASLFDLERFGAAFAYTVDGGDVGELEYENFNAAGATVSFRGLSVHPGTAKNAMVNAQNLAMEFHGMLPAAERPEHTEGREGFYHLTSMIGTVSGAKLGYILRDHDQQRFEARKQRMRDIAAWMNHVYGEGTVTLDMQDSYYNMLEKIKPHMHLVEHARTAIRAAGLEPTEQPVRGGTDGALLSYMGLPCPNLGTGGFNFHGVYEFITAERMDRAVQVLVNLVQGYADGVQ